MKHFNINLIRLFLCALFLLLKPILAQNTVYLSWSDLEQMGVINHNTDAAPIIEVSKLYQQLEEESEHEKVDFQAHLVLGYAIQDIEPASYQGKTLVTFPIKQNKYLQFKVGTWNTHQSNASVPLAKSFNYFLSLQYRAKDRSIQPELALINQAGGKDLIKKFDPFFLAKGEPTQSMIIAFPWINGIMSDNELDKYNWTQGDFLEAGHKSGFGYLHKPEEASLAQYFETPGDLMTGATTSGPMIQHQQIIRLKPRHSAVLKACDIILNICYAHDLASKYEKSRQAVLDGNDSRANMFYLGAQLLSHLKSIPNTRLGFFVDTTSMYYSDGTTQNPETFLGGVANLGFMLRYDIE
ncbi:MAG TPA: hypothetical protein PKC21_04785 [Oligoflexia bacterium]|nr:hypothetical protein [Oligoflexia bacterium]HMR24653.1 hypothetical protein [Oligoflexia bacterium]